MAVLLLMLLLFPLLLKLLVEVATYWAIFEGTSFSNSFCYVVVSFLLRGQCLLFFDCRDIEQYFEQIDVQSRLAVFRKRMGVEPPSKTMIEEQALTYRYHC